MKRMNVREFRAKVSELHQEPIEVVRYHETVGYWIPIEMTTEPPVTKKPPRLTAKKMGLGSEAYLKEIERIRAEMEKLIIDGAKRKVPTK